MQIASSKIYQERLNQASLCLKDRFASGDYKTVLPFDDCFDLLLAAGGTTAIASGNSIETIGAVPGTLANTTDALAESVFLGGSSSGVFRVVKNRAVSNGVSNGMTQGVNAGMLVLQNQTTSDPGMGACLSAYMCFEGDPLVARGCLVGCFHEDPVVSSGGSSGGSGESSGGGGGSGVSEDGFRKRRRRLSGRQRRLSGGTGGDEEEEEPPRCKYGPSLNAEARHIAYLKSIGLLPATAETVPDTVYFSLVVADPGDDPTWAPTTPR